MNPFLTYVLDFYGPYGIHPFDPPMTLGEARLALEIRKKMDTSFHADAFDRELIRDIVRAARNDGTELEYPVVRNLFSNLEESTA